MKKLAILTALAVVIPAQASPWKTTNHGEPYVLSTNYNGGPDVQYSAAVFSEWAMSTDGVHQVRAVTFAGRKMDAGMDNEVCPITAVINGNKYKTVAVSTTAKKGQLPTLMVMDSTDTEYRARAPGASVFIDALKRAKRFIVVANCGEKTMIGSYEPDMPYNEMKKAQ